MTPKQLRLVRNFFVQNDKSIDSIVAQSFANFLASTPEGAALFMGALTAHRETFTRMLRRIAALTRAIYLWPVSAETGLVAIPGFADLREKHIRAGVTAAYLEAMKLAMIRALETSCPATFTDEVRDAFAAFYAILAHSLTDARGSGMTSDSELRSLLNRPQSPLAASFDSFFDAAPGTVPESV